MSIVDGWFALDGGTTQVDLGAFQVGGVSTDDLRRSIHAMATTRMDDPGSAEQGIAGSRVTIYDTAETRGDYVNCMYTHDDIAWVFATFKEQEADVLERYRARVATRSSPGTSSPLLECEYRGVRRPRQ